MGIVGDHMIYTLTVDSVFVVYVLNCLKFMLLELCIIFIKKTTLYGLYVVKDWVQFAMIFLLHVDALFWYNMHIKMSDVKHGSEDVSIVVV